MKRILELQKEIGALSKNAKNPFFKSQYLDLNDLITHVQPLLNAKGLILMQPITDGNVVSQIIDAESGDVLIESSMALPNILDPQKMGSAITYYRRYTLKSMLAIAETDDDGNLASKINYPKLLVESTTLKELGTAWESLPGSEKSKLLKLKEDLKARLSTPPVINV